MKISVNNGVPTPQAYVAINKSRVKMYNKDSKTPVFYLQKGQEFQLELFNPTTDSILAKIFLNGNAISQGGLVLRPGERVFLDRYIDVAKKFLFDTYEVGNTSEIKKAIEDNGDFKVEFYKEFTSSLDWLTINKPITLTYYDTNYSQKIGTTYDNNIYGSTATNFTSSLGLTSNGDLSNYSSNLSSNNLNYNTTPEGPNPRSPRSFAKKNKSIETGRVEKGSTSDQKLTTVNMTWEIYPFHTIEYKLLPLSQKIIGSEDIKIKRYCTNCGSKLGPKHKFCANCGSKA
jgi:hypothetical protein